MAEPEKMDLKSMNIPEDKKEQLKQLFPEVFTEKKIDLEKLKLTLGEMIETEKERYGLNWAGKADCFKIIQQPSVGTLKPCREESINFDDTDNIFIEGDNLEVLKLLQKSYYGRVKMICIDPPYNTGNDFIYPDDYSESLDTYLKYTGQIDSEGRKYSTNTEADGRFHTKWINMMYPRLYLARNLLRDDGLIFIHIDDNEVVDLRRICDEIFGEENFVVSFIWKRRQNVDSRPKNGASLDHEYVLVYSKQTNSGLRGGEKDLDKYANPDNDPKGKWMSADMTGLATKDQRPNLHYDLIDPKTGINYGCPVTGWRYEKKRMAIFIKNGEILFPKDPSGRPRRKKYLIDLKSEFTGKSSILDTVYNTQATRELRDLFDGKDYFEFPKPVDLLKELIMQTPQSKSNANETTSDIILDFFSGSATTAHAVLELNRQDKRNRKFIMVQLPEPCVEDSEAFKAGYKTITDIGKERIRRVIKKITDEEVNKLKYDNSKQELGFKVFKLDKSNFKIWKAENAEEAKKLEEQLQLHVDHIDPKSTQEDILYELLLKSGFDLATKIEKLSFAGKIVYSIAGGAMLICLEEKLTKEVINNMAEMKPSRVICLDKGFKDNDQLKANAVQIMKSKKVNTFLTV